MKRSKVFGIGFHKTGTTSLAASLKQLGYKVTGPNGRKNPNIRIEVFDMAYELVEKFDAFQDNPWPIIYKDLDSKYPGSKFILTIRPTDDWIRSVVKNFGTRSTAMREWIYGVAYPLGNEKIYTDRYDQHNQEVINYFKERPDDLLVFNITQGDGWDKLCDFLGADYQAQKFPRKNRSFTKPLKRVKKRVKEFTNKNGLFRKNSG